jgi:transposase InsO family protein
MPWLGRVSSATAARTANAGTMGARRRTGPDQAQTSRFARRVARTLRHAGWRLERVLTDDGNESQSDFRAAIEALGARHTNIRAGRPQTNGHVERPHRTIPEECWAQLSHGFSTCATAACNASSTPT